ncbi:SGNH/GDSL hydrolase family protein [bacterium]|nr:SGNH/GDSL hydrolase family protein [bacterium]
MIKRLSKYLLFFLILFLLFEGLARLLDPISKLQDYDRRIFEKDSELGYRYRKSSSYMWRNKKFTINSSGYRNLNTIEKSEKNIICIGDSITAGLGVEDDETYPVFLQGELKEFNVHNMGVCGYGLDQNIVILEKNLQKNPPEIVVWQYFIDDILYAFHLNGIGFLELDTDAEVIVTKRPFSYSYLFALAKLLFAGNYEKAYNSKEFYASAAMKYNDPYLRKDLTKKIERIKMTCEKRKIHPIFIITPLRYQLLNRADFSYQEVMREVFQECRVDFVDISQEMRKTDLLLYDDLYVDDIHFSPEGNRYIAGVLADHIRRIE